MALGHLSRRQFLQTAAAASAVAAAASDRPNIIFLMADEHRYDALNCLGNSAVHSPNLDRIASEGVRFTHTYCNGPLCQPSRASIMTGRYPHQHGQTWNRNSMKPEWPTMMKQLQKAGYTTAKLGKAHFGGGGIGPSGSKDLRDNEAWGRSFGFDYLLEEYDKFIHATPGIKTPYTEYLRERKLLETYLTQIPSMTDVAERKMPLYEPATSKLPQEHMQCSFVADRSIDWLRGYKKDKPFFLWVSFIEPHPPIIDSTRWASHYKSAKIPVGPVVMPDLPDNAWGNYLRTWIQSTRTGNLTPEHVSEIARHYYGEISLIDQKIGDIFKAVDDLGLGKNTWIFYTADHGEMLGDHKMMYKNVFYRGSVRVPNIVRPAGGMKAKTVDSLVESIDLSATFLDLAGAHMPECQGRSLVPAIKGNGKTRDVVHSELAGHQNKGNFFIMAANQRYRYTYDKENKLACELYDLEKDHDEMHNLVDDPAYGGIRKDMHKDYVEEFMNS
jgi:arylsulfatase A-like enzyme